MPKKSTQKKAIKKVAIKKLPKKSTPKKVLKKVVKKTVKKEFINPADALIEKAIDKGSDADVIGKLIELKEKLRKENAEKQYLEAMAEFQSECGIIKKTRKVRNSEGNIVYCYASIEDIVIQVKDLIKEKGFCYSIQTEKKQDSVRSVCIVEHIEGHREQSGMEVDLEKKKKMTNPQIVASASTFSKRYAFCNAFGILTSEEDNDGNTETILEEPEKEVKYEKVEPCEKCGKQISEQVSSFSKMMFAGKAYCEDCQPKTINKKKK